jgi:predicted AAA+ superfamily ATPase
LLSGNLPAERSVASRLGDPVDWMLRGFMPPLFDLPRVEDWTQWWEGYVATYLERDLRQVAQIEALTDFRRVMQLAALRSGQLLNQSEVARDARVPQPTVHRYLNLLETTYLAQRVPAYASSRTTRVVKSPKLFWTDPGLAIFLAGYFDAESLARSRELGAFFETLVFHHLAVLSQLLTPRPASFFWRTQRGQEIDFVIEHGRRIIAIEVKMTSTVRFSDISGLTAFMQEHPNAAAGALVYTGNEIRRLGEKIVAIPWHMIVGATT